MNAHNLAALEAWLLVLYRENALVGRNHDTLFIDMARASALVGREKLVEKLRLVCGEIVWNSTGLLCASIRPGLLDKAAPRSRAGHQQVDAIDENAALRRFLGFFSWLPVLKGSAKQILETEQHALLIFAQKDASPCEAPLAS